MLHVRSPADNQAGSCRRLAAVAEDAEPGVLGVEDQARLPAEEIGVAQGQPDRGEPLEARTTLALLAGVTSRIRLRTELTLVTRSQPGPLAADAHWTARAAVEEVAR